MTSYAMWYKICSTQDTRLTNLESLQVLHSVEEVLGADVHLAIGQYLKNKMHIHRYKLLLIQYTTLRIVNNYCMLVCVITIVG